MPGESPRHQNKSPPYIVFPFEPRDLFRDACERKKMLHISIKSSDAMSALRMLARVRAVALPLVMTITGTGGISSLLPAPARATEYAWCIARESEVLCDYTTYQQCRAAGSGIGESCYQNPHLVVQAPTRNANAKLKK